MRPPGEFTSCCRTRTCGWSTERRRPSGEYADVWMRAGDRGWAIELKYATRALTAAVSGEPFALLDQAAQDVIRHDFGKDVARLERVVARAPSTQWT